jgi:hypothetical protein
VTEQFGRFSGQPSLLDRIGCRLSLDVLGRELLGVGGYRAMHARMLAV